MKGLKKPVKDPNRVFPRILSQAKDADMLPPDYLSVSSLLFAFAGAYLSSPILSWAAFFTLVSSFLRRSRTDFDKVQSFISGTVTLAVMASNYSKPTYHLVTE